MNQFAQSNPTQNSFWAETEDVSLLEAALLSLGIEPFALGEYMEACGEPVSLEELPNGFLTRIEALRSAIRTRKFNTVTMAMDAHGRFDEAKTRIPMDKFLEWCDEKGITVSIPGLQRSAPAHSPWPWGGHDTELLRKLDAAARKWWVNHDPDDQTTAPTNDEVAGWLKEQGVSKRVAEVMAQMLRADGLPTGPRGR